jgi:hypothetical protein
MGKIMSGKYLKNGKYKMNKDGTPWEEEVEDPTCLYKSDVINIIGEKNWDKFSKWMTGQGAPIMSDGSMGYFAWDVDKFYRHHVLGEPGLTKDDIAMIIEVSRSIDGKMNSKHWNTSRKGKDVTANEHNKKKHPEYRCGLKRTKMRWNKKKGLREKSKKGSKERIYWSD